MTFQIVTGDIKQESGLIIGTPGAGRDFRTLDIPLTAADGRPHNVLLPRGTRRKINKNGGKSMKIKRITQVVSLVMILLLLVSVFPLTGAISAVAAETESAAETALSEVTEPAAASASPEATQAAEEEPDAPELSTEPAPETEATAEKSTEPDPAPEGLEPEPTEEAVAEEIPELEDYQAEPQPVSDQCSDAQAIGPVSDLEATSATMWVPLNLYGSAGNVLRVSFQYPNDPSGTTYSTTITGMKIHYIYLSNSNDKVAYCLEPQASSTAGDVYSEIAGGDDLNVWKQFLSDAQRSAISLALAYGAPNTINSTNDLTRHGYEVATQVIIWEIIVGDRSTVAPYTRTNTRLYDFFDPLVSANDSSGVLKSAFEAAYISITSAMSQHGKLPSFAAKKQSEAPTHAMTYNSSTGLYTLTLTDTNNAINNDYPYVNGNGLTFSKSGNKLTITATRAALQNGPVTVASTGSDPDVDSVAPVIWGTSRSNHKVGQILCQMTSPDPVKAYFKLEAQAFGSPFSIQKIDPSGAPLKGAVFQVEYYYNAEWFDPELLDRTWYFKTDENGFFTLTAQYLAAGYTSSELFPADAIPVGIMRVREIAAPEGYRMADFTGVWRMKQVESGASNVNSYWAARNGYTPTNSYGDAAYVLDAEPGKLYVKNVPATEPGTMTMLKSLPAGVNGSKEGYAFQLYRFTDAAAGVSNATYYGRSDDDGRIYRTNSRFSEPDEKVYTFAGLVDGKYAFREVLSLMETQDLRTQCVRITTSGGITPAIDLTFQGDDLHWATNGDCTISGIVITGLNGGGMLTIEITNAPITTSTSGSLTIVKVDRGSRTPLEGAGFRLYDAEGNQIAEGYTDQDGSLTFGDLAIGEYAYQEFEAPEGFVLDETLYPFSVTETNPDITIERENEIAEGTIRVRKIDEKGQPMANVFFLLEYSLNEGMSWLPINVRDDLDPVMIGYTTNDDTYDGIAPTSAPHGWIRFDGLAINNQLGNIKYRLTEVQTRDDYQLLTEPVFEGYLTSELTEIERIAVNHPTFQMPMTGSGGFTAAGIGLGLCLLASVLLLLFLPKKREDMKNG